MTVPESTNYIVLSDESNLKFSAFQALRTTSLHERLDSSCCTDSVFSFSCTQVASTAQHRAPSEVPRTDGVDVILGLAWQLVKLFFDLLSGFLTNPFSSHIRIMNLRGDLQGKGCCLNPSPSLLSLSSVIYN